MTEARCSEIEFRGNPDVGQPSVINAPRCCNTGGYSFRTRASYRHAGPAVGAGRVQRPRDSESDASNHLLVQLQPVRPISAGCADSPEGQAGHLSDAIEQQIAPSDDKWFNSTTPLQLSTVRMMESPARTIYAQMTPANRQPKHLARPTNVDQNSRRYNLETAPASGFQNPITNPNGQQRPPLSGN